MGTHRRDLAILLGHGARRASSPRATPPALVQHQPRRPPERREVHQLHRPLSIRPQQSATVPAVGLGTSPADVDPQRLAGLVVDAEHLHIAQSHQSLTHARRVALHRDPPVIRLL